MSQRVRLLRRKKLASLWGFDGGLNEWKMPPVFLVRRIGEHCYLYMKQHPADIAFSWQYVGVCDSSGKPRKPLK